MRTVPAAAGVCARLGRRPGHPLRPPIVGASRRARRRHQLPPPHKAADLLRDGVHAAGRDRGERWAGGQRTVSAAPEACHPAPVGRRDRSFALSRACCGLRRWTMPGAPLLSPLPTSAQHSPALVCAGGPAAWCLRPSAGTGTSRGRLEGAGRARSLGLPAALDVMPGARVQDAHLTAQVGVASRCRGLFAARALRNPVPPPPQAESCRWGQPTARGTARPT